MKQSEHGVKSVTLKRLFKFELKFYKALLYISKFTKIHLNIPEMIIFGFGFSTPTLFCTDYRTGEVLIKENLTNQAISESFMLFSSTSSETNGIPVAVCKTQFHLTSHDRVHVLFTSADCETTWNLNISRNKPQIIQRFIRNLATAVLKSEYSVANKLKTCLVRKKNERDSSKGGGLKKNSDKLKYLVSNNDNCSRFPVASATIENKMVYLVYLIEKYYIKEYNIKITQLKCNWIEDVLGNVYFLNLKHYNIATNAIKEPPMKPSGSLPTISFVKKIKEMQDKSQTSTVSIVSSPIWLHN